MPLTRIFIFEKATKNTYRFQEVPAEDIPVMAGVLYVQKAAFDKQPEAITVSIEVVK